MSSMDGPVLTKEMAAWFEKTVAVQPLMAILRSTGVNRATTIASRAWDLGFDTVEVTLQSAEDFVALREVCRLAGERDKVVGAGTIVSVDQIPGAIDAGAAYLVSPGLDPHIIRAAQDHGVPILPGVATPSEVQFALSLGLTWLKAFPAQWLGPDWFRHIRGPFPSAQFIATGGLDATSVPAFLNAGVRVAAVGSALEDTHQLKALAKLLR